MNLMQKRLPKAASLLTWFWAMRAAASWSLADQMIVSLGSLITGLLLVRLAGPAEYGVYVLVFSVHLAMQSIQGGLITGPLTVFGASMRGRALDRYTTAVTRLQMAMGLSVATVVLISAWVCNRFGADTALTHALIALSIAVFWIQSQEAIRRWLMSRLMMRQAATNDLVHQALRLLGIGLTASWTTHQTLSAASVVWVFAGAGVLATGFGIVQMRASQRIESIPRSNASPIRATVRRHWHFGRWQLLSAGITFAYTQGVYFYLAGVAGTTAVGLLDGPRLIVAPCMLLIVAWGNLAGPLAAKQYSAMGISAVSRVIAGLAPVLLITVIGCAALTTAGGAELLGYVLGQSFAQADGLTPKVLSTWAWVMVMMSVSTVSAAIFSATRQPFYGTWCRAAGALAGAASIAMVSGNLNIESAASARLAAEATVALVSVALACVLLRRSKQREPLVSINHRTILSG